MIKVNVSNETSRLKAVVLGIANSNGPTPTIDQAYDPKSKEHILNETYPDEEDLIKEMSDFAQILEKYDVKVYRPEVLENTNQVFSRDIGFVIEDKFIKPTILEDRGDEILGIQHIIDRIATENIIETTEGVQIEGGDVMPWNEYIFVGYSELPDFEQYTVARTNKEGVDFLQKHFPHKTVKGFELSKSDDNAKDNALHLDCCFQPIGNGQAIIYKAGFKNEEDYDFLINYFGRDNVIDIIRDEMYDMNSNVFSISPSVIVSEKGFTRLNVILRERGFTVEEVSYAETAKMEGLLRCSTMPLIRDKKI